MNYLRNRSRESPDAIAVVFEDQQVTYRELNNRANQLAHYLQKLGVGPEMLVGLCLERSIDMIVGLLAILKAGGAYVPLDPNYPKDRLDFMLQDSNTSVILTHKPLASMLPAANARIIFLDEEDWRAITPGLADRANLTAQISPNQAAYVIYTSGSTGTPKGTLVTHYNVVRLFQATEAWFGFNSSDIVDAVPLLCVRLLGLGDLGRPVARRQACHRAPGDYPFAARLCRAADQAPSDRAQSNPVGVPPADSRADWRQRP